MEKLQFEVKPKVGIGPVKLGASRAEAIESMQCEPQSFLKTSISVHPTDAFYSSAFQIFYEGIDPIVESIELSRDDDFDVTMSNIKILELTVPEALKEIKRITGLVPKSEDGGYSYEISDLGLWLWRPEIDDEEGQYFATIGVAAPNT